MRVSQNNLPSNNGIDENDGGIDESKQNVGDNYSSSKPTSITMI